MLFSVRRQTRSQDTPERGGEAEQVRDQRIVCEPVSESPKTVVTNFVTDFSDAQRRIQKKLFRRFETQGIQELCGRYASGLAKDAFKMKRAKASNACHIMKRQRLVIPCAHLEYHALNCAPMTF